MLDQSQRLIKNVLRPLVPKSVLQIRQQSALKQYAAQNRLNLVRRDLFFDLERGDKVLRIRKAHSVYMRHMIENFDYYFGSVIPLQMNGRLLVDMSGPRYHKLKGFGDIPFLFPSHTEPYLTTAEYLDFAALQGGETVLDIGAYSGVTSIIFAQLVGPNGHVFAFEADDTNCECAQINIEMAARVLGVTNITLLHKAIWSHGNGLLFSHEGAMGSSAVTITHGGRGTERTVPSIRLDEFVAERGLKHVDFVKVDIEGCEVEVLEASAGSLKDIGARLIVEPHFVDGAMSTERCRTLLEAAGYKASVRSKVGESEPLIEAIP
jgi:FkbM family methyltransferase